MPPYLAAIAKVSLPMSAPNEDVSRWLRKRSAVRRNRRLGTTANAKNKSKPKARPQDTLTRRWCSHCRTMLPFTEFRWLTSRGGRYQYSCRPCENRYRRIWRAERKATLDEPPKPRGRARPKPDTETHRYCLGCKKMLLKRKFNVVRKSRSGSVMLSIRCQPCSNAVHKEGQRIKRAADPKAFAARRAARVGYNPVEVCALPAEQPKAKCETCNATKNLTNHHIIPASEGGSHTAGNLIALCNACGLARAYARGLARNSPPKSR